MLAKDSEAEELRLNRGYGCRTVPFNFQGGEKGEGGGGCKPQDGGIEAIMGRENVRRDDELTSHGGPAQPVDRRRLLNEKGMICVIWRTRAGS